jgi:TolB-like protein
MPDIFLSYTREDQTTAQRFAEAFQAQGFSVWWDVTLRSGEAYDQVTEEALRTAKAVVVLWSKKSVVSRWVRAEATLADRNRTLVPARIETCDLPIMFELTQTADLCRWDGGASDPAWRAFLADVRRFLEAAREPRPPAARLAAEASPLPLQSTYPSLAVLPFINRSELGKDDVFADAMAEDLIAALSGNPYVRVVAARATAVFRQKAFDVRQIGRELGVRYLLEGNLRRVGQDLRVTAQLVETESGNVLWTQKFERPLVEVSALQDDLVAEIAAHFGVQVRRAEMEHARRQSGNLSAWDALMRASVRSEIATRTGWEAAVAEAKRAIEIDPDEGVAYAWLATTQGQLWRFHGGDDPGLAQEVIDNVRRARALNPDHPAVLSFAGWALACLRKLQDALPLVERAVALTPQDEGVRLTLGGTLARLGRSDEALAQLDEAERVGPNSVSLYYSLIWRALAHLRAGRLEQALEASDRAVRLRPAPEALVLTMLGLAKSNRWQAACEAMHSLRDTDPEMSRALVESLVRDFYGGTDVVEEDLAIARRLWDATEGGL